MPVTGCMFIGRERVAGTAGSFQAVDPATGGALAPLFGGATSQMLERACALAAQSFDTYRETALGARATFLETIAANILDLGDELVVRGVAETGLARARLEGERQRTVDQLRIFAQVVREGSFVEPRLDSPLSSRRPLPRPDLRMRHLAVGPVAVFGASNFPLAFSVAGGDTASALAAGCPVIVKAHNAHPGVSELVGTAVQRAVRDCGLPEGVFSMLFGADTAVGAALVADPRIKAVGFTGSRAGGMALMRIAAERSEPISVHAEMSSVNPVFLLPGALAARGAAVAKAFVASLNLGAGQFCTNPGLLITLEGPQLDAFISLAAAEVRGSTAATMLASHIHRAYETGLSELSAMGGVTVAARGERAPGCKSQTALLVAHAETVLADKRLQAELFGPASLLVRCRDMAQLRELAESLEGQLTAAVHMEEADLGMARQLLPVLERKAGRVLFNGFPTGVEVSHAMVHGGPYPATSDPRFTSVGTLAIRRFLRPVCYQDMPAALLPQSLQDGNPLGLQRLKDGRPGLD
ncbi:MAG TPA: aldehyde dehydrogenase (NADP(+)) [Steroidobacteraceae bacterium]|nr:aldehyde dehydrogenase (NADP(+)) [Steroidobacteraceae bacterium]